MSALCRASVRAVTHGQPLDLITHWAKMLSPQRLAEVLATQWCIVAEDDGACRGLASLDGDVLGMLYVHPDHQGRGIARRLVEEVAAEARLRGILVLRVDASLNAVDAYKHWGFMDDGVREKVDTVGVTYRVHRMHVPVLRLLG